MGMSAEQKDSVKKDLTEINEIFGDENPQMKEAYNTLMKKMNGDDIQDVEGKHLNEAVQEYLTLAKTNGTSLAGEGLEAVDKASQRISQTMNAEAPAQNTPSNNETAESDTKQPTDGQPEATQPAEGQPQAAQPEESVKTKEPMPEKPEEAWKDEKEHYIVKDDHKEVQRQIKALKEAGYEPLKDVEISGVDGKRGPKTNASVDAVLGEGAHNLSSANTLKALEDLKARDPKVKEILDKANGVQPEEPKAEDAPVEEPKAEDAPVEEPKAEDAPVEEPKAEDASAPQAEGSEEHSKDVAEIRGDIEQNMYQVTQETGVDVNRTLSGEILEDLQHNKPMEEIKPKITQYFDEVKASSVVTLEEKEKLKAVEADTLAQADKVVAVENKDKPEELKSEVKAEVEPVKVEPAKPIVTSGAPSPVG